MVKMYIYTYLKLFYPYYLTKKIYKKTHYFNYHPSRLYRLFDWRVSRSRKSVSMWFHLHLKVNLEIQINNICVHVFQVLCCMEESTSYLVDLGVQQSSGKVLHQQDPPCVVCRSPRSSVHMIPARNLCYGDWNLEYTGYLVGGHYGHTAASEFICLDEDPEVVAGGEANKNGKLFYFAEARCGSLKCPPYINGRELTCAVCSK